MSLSSSLRATLACGLVTASLFACAPPPDKSQANANRATAKAEGAETGDAPATSGAEPGEVLTLEECRRAQLNLNRLLGQGINVAAMCAKPEALPDWGEQRWTEVRCFAEAQTLEALEACGDEGMARLAARAREAPPPP